MKAVVIFISKESISPALLLESNGDCVRHWLEQAKTCFASGDSEKTFARFAAFCCNQMPRKNHISVKSICAGDVDKNCYEEVESFYESHSVGGAGVFLVNVDTWQACRYDSYDADFIIEGPISNE